MSAIDAREELRVHIRWLIRRDMPEVLEIERESFDISWYEEDFLRCLRQRNCIGMVAELGEKIAGFMIYELHKTKLHILNFAVHVKYRRNRIGMQMIRKLVSKLSSHRRTAITLEVRETNLSTQIFFRGAGFRALRVLRVYYDDTGEDAYLMRYRYKPPSNRTSARSEESYPSDVIVSPCYEESDECGDHDEDDRQTA